MEDLAERVAVLRDEVLETALHGDSAPPGAEIFDAVVRALIIGGSSLTGIDLHLYDAAARRLAWGDTEQMVLADVDAVYSKLLKALERSFRDVDDQMAIIEVATQVSASVARVVAMHAVQRGNHDRAARMREEMTQRHLKEAIEKQKTAIARLEVALKAAIAGQ
jgi:hypothetical protein